MCISHPLGEVLLRNATWDLWSNTLFVEELLVNHLQSSSSTAILENQTKASKPLLALPTYLPIVSVKKMSVHSFWLVKPINIAISQPSPSLFKLSGDIDANIGIENQKISAQLQWSLLKLYDTLPAAKRLFDKHSTNMDSESLLNANINSQLTFDGERLTSVSGIDLSTLINVYQCNGTLSANGEASIEANIKDSSASVDLSKLSLNLVPHECSALPSGLQGLYVQNFEAKVPNSINFDTDRLTITEVSLTSSDKKTLSLTLNNINLSISDGSFDYEFSSQIALKGLDEKQGNIDLLSVGQLNFNEQDLTFNSTKNSLQLSDILLDELVVEQLESSFNVTYTHINGWSGKGKADALKVRAKQLSFASFTTQYSLEGPSLNDIYLSTNNQSKNVSVNQNTAQNLAISQYSSNLDFHLTNLNELSISGQSHLRNITANKIPIKLIGFTHLAKGDLNKQVLTSEHTFTINEFFRGTVEQNQQQLKITVTPQEIKLLESVIAPLRPELDINEGLISGFTTINLDNTESEGEFALTDFSAQDGEYQISKLNYQNSFTFNSAGLQLPDTTLTVNLVDVGVPISHIQASLTMVNSEAKINSAKGRIMGGEFSLNNVWLDGREQRANLNLDNIELAQLVALQQQSGIDISGTIQGILPIQNGIDGIRIESAKIMSEGPGTLKIKNNSAFNAIKMQQPELSFLEDMDFEQLSSSVKLDTDGWLHLGFSLLGKNELKNQSVNFNYKHEENILTLLKSLRLANSVQNKIEKSIIKGGEN
jgi:hypothetical protein